MSFTIALKIKIVNYKSNHCNYITTVTNVTAMAQTTWGC